MQDDRDMGQEPIIEEVSKEETPQVETPEPKDEGQKDPQISPEEVEKLKKANDDLLQQLIAERKKRQVAETKQVVQPKEEDEYLGGEDDTRKQVLAILQKKEEEQINANRVKALEKFWGEYPQYNPSNDLTGLNMDRVNQVVKERINTSNSKSVEEIMSDYRDAIRLIEQTDKQKTVKKNNIDNSNASTPNVPTSPSVSSTDSGLTAEDKKMAQQAGMSEQKYKELKARHPSIVANL